VIAMIAMFATFVFATAGCASSAVIGTSIRNALPVLRRLSGQRGALASDPLALDRVYLVSLIETPRHDGALAPVPAIAVPENTVAARVVAKRGAAKAQVLRGTRTAARPFRPSKVHAAA